MIDCMSRGNGVRVGWAERRTYRQRAPKRIMMLTWKRCEIPRAKHRNIHITPVLP